MLYTAFGGCFLYTLIFSTGHANGVYESITAQLIKLLTVFQVLYLCVALRKQFFPAALTKNKKLDDVVYYSCWFFFVVLVVVDVVAIAQLNHTYRR